MSMNTPGRKLRPSISITTKMLIFVILINVILIASVASSEGWHGLANYGHGFVGGANITIYLWLLKLKSDAERFRQR